jgi:hypothetical protein
MKDIGISTLIFAILDTKTNYTQNKKQLCEKNYVRTFSRISTNKSALPY